MKLVLGIVRGSAVLALCLLVACSPATSAPPQTVQGPTPAIVSSPMAATPAATATAITSGIPTVAATNAPTDVPAVMPNETPLPLPSPRPTVPTATPALRPSATPGAVRVSSGKITPNDYPVEPLLKWSIDPVSSMRYA